MEGRTDKHKTNMHLNFSKFGGLKERIATVLPAKSDSEVMFCWQSYQQLITDGTLVY